MTFPIKKIINTEQLIVGMSALLNGLKQYERCRNVRRDQKDGIYGFLLEEHVSCRQ